MKRIIISLLIIMGPVITILGGEKEETVKNLVKETTGQVLTPEMSERQRHIQHYEKVITEYRQGKWKLNNRELQMVLMNLADLYNEAGDKEKSRQYQNELAELESRHPEIKLRDDVRQDTEKSIQEHEGKLTEFRQAKRDYRDAYLILRILTADYNRLRQKGKAMEYVRDLEALKAKYPDLVSDPPQELSEQRKAREELERKKEELIKKPFIPKDNSAVVFKSSNNVALIYRYRIEFYKLPGETDIYIDSAEDGELRKYGLEPFANRFGHVKFCHKSSVYKIQSKRNYSLPVEVYHAASEVKVKPHKVMTFKYGVGVAPIFPSDNQRAILIYSHLIPELGGGYTPCDKEEWSEYFLLRDEWPGKKWINKSGQYDEFFGVVDIKGNIIGKIPFKSQLPDFVVEPLNVSPDGTKVVCAVARWGPEPADGINTFVDHREYLLWEYPDKVEKIAISDSGIELYKARGATVWQLFEKNKK